MDPFLEAAHAGDDPFLAAAQGHTPTVTFGPLEVQGFTAPDALAREVAPIQAAWKIAQRESNEPAMAAAREGMRPTAGGTAANIALSGVISPLLPRTAEAGVDAALRDFTAGGGDASANANLFGAASALGAVGGNIGLGAALPAPGGTTRGMGLRQIGTQLLRAGATEGAVQGALSGGGALLEGVSPEEAAKIGLEQGATVGTLGALFRGLHGAGSIREAILRPRPTDVDLDVLSGRQEFIPPEGRTTVREVPRSTREPSEVAYRDFTPRTPPRSPMDILRERPQRTIPARAERTPPPVRGTGNDFLDFETRDPGLPPDVGTYRKAVTNEKLTVEELASKHRTLMNRVQENSRYTSGINNKANRGAPGRTVGIMANDLKAVQRVESELRARGFEPPAFGSTGPLLTEEGALPGQSVNEESTLPHDTGGFDPNDFLPALDEAGAAGKRTAGSSESPLSLPSDEGVNLRLVNDETLGRLQTNLEAALRERPNDPALTADLDAISQAQRDRIPDPEMGAGAPRLLAGTAGGIGGAAYGATQGDTPKERAKNALLYGLGGLALGATGGYLAERVGAKSAAVLEAEQEAGKSLVQAARVGSRTDIPSEPSPFRDAPPPLRAISPAPGEHGPVQGTPYVRLDKFGMDRDATARLRVEAERIGREVQGSPRRVATWDEWRDTAASLGLGDVTRKDYRAMTVPDLLAIQNLVATNTDRLTQLDTEARAPGVSDTELARMNLETSALNSQNDLLLRKFIPARTEAGRTLNSFRIIASRNFEPVWWLAKAQDIKGAPLNDAELAQVRGLLNAQDREGLVQAIARLRQASGLDKAVSYWKANLLSSPKTHLVNTANNAALGALETVKDIPAALADQLLSLSTGRRTVAGPSWLQLRAAAEGARDGLQQAKLILRGALPPEALAKLDIPQETHFDNPIVEGYTQGVFRFLSAADRIPRMAAMRRALANQAEVLAHTEGLTGEDYTARVHDLIEHPTSEMAVQATAEAEQAVVQDQTAAGTVLRAVGKFPVVGQFIMPFQRTPGAVATRIGEYTFGAPYELGNVTRLAAQGKLKDIPVADQRRIAMLTGRGVTGASLIALGALAYHRRWLTGPPADWRKDRSQATTDALRGVQGNSIVANIGGHRIQFDIGRLSPVGNLVAIGAMSAQAAEDRDPETSPWAAGMLGAITTVANQPFLQGIQNVTEAANDPSRFGEKLVGGIARGFIPASGLLGAVTRGTDPNIRMTEGIPEQLQAQIPGVSRVLPTRPNPLGEPTTRQGGVLGALSQVSPVGMQEQVQGDPVLDALGQYDVTVTGFSPKKGESSGDFQTRAQQAGQLRREELDATVNSQEWDADTSFESRQEMLQQALRRAAGRQAQLTRQGRTLSNPFRR